MRAAGIAGVLALLASASLPGAALSSSRDGPAKLRPPASTLAGSPWPEMRRDSRNTASSPIRGRYRGGAPWSFRTDRGVFSTPVLGDDETVYVGSADGAFYAIDRSGELEWRFRTGGIIDSAAALGQRWHDGRAFPITFGSGDELLYQLRSSPSSLPRSRRIRWRYRASLPPATGQLVNWWEGNVVYGPDGNLYAGNTGGGVYSLTPGGTVRWIVQRGNSVWTAPAFDEQGNSFWGSVDLHVFSLDPAGAQRWQRVTAGYVTSSPAIGADGAVYVGSFDRQLHALDPATGEDRWTFPTADHIYGSPALAAGPDGETSAVYIGSADGSVYAVGPDGSLIWSYDTGEPVRSSPALGKAPEGGGRIVYVGSSNGKLYALDAETGKRRWSFDTSPKDPRLRDRDDLNGSPALGRRGVYIGGEHGRIWFVPYDYCLRRHDRRCERAPGEEFPDDVDAVLPVTPGGTTRKNTRLTVSPSTALGGRLIVRSGGVTADAGMVPSPDADALVEADPPFDFEAQLSGDGQYLFVRPNRFLAPDSHYRVRLHGGWLAESENGGFDTTLQYRTAPSRRARIGLRAGRRRVSALEISRLALPLPALLPSVNQIGFDSYDLIAGTLAKTKPAAGGTGEILMWVVGARPRGHGPARVDPNGNFAFPLAGTYRRDMISLNASDVDLQFSFGPVPLRSLDFRGQLDATGRFRPGATLYGQVTCGSVPNYSIYLYAAGVCNAADTLAAYGTFLSRGYPAAGDAARRPPGVRGGAVTLRRPTATEAGEAVADLELAANARFRARSHLASLLLVDANTGQPVSLDYRKLTTPVVDANGDVSEVRLSIPAGTALPDRIRAYVIADVFPLAVSEPVG